MTSKRKRERENENDVRMKRQRRRKRSSSDPGLLYDPINAEKLHVLKRLFGRNSTYDGDTASSGTTFARAGDTASSGATFARAGETFNRNGPTPREEPCDAKEECDNNGDSPGLEEQNSDPLLDSVPVDLDPEQLGFLVCAQETLRFLYGRGFPSEHPVFICLRSRLLRGMDELAVA